MASSSGDHDHVQHKIFLSYTGTEKDFVEQLFEDLHNIYPRQVFFDKDPGSLPPGENFPNHIFDAAQNFEVAVIVISESYFKRKWPMTELATLVNSQSESPKLKILPLFYKLSVKEFKQQGRQRRWFKEWKNFKNSIEGSRINDETLKSWKVAVRHIYCQNGIEMTSEEGEVTYRKRIVRALRDMVPPVTQFDVSHVEGKDHICTFFRKRLELFNANRPPCFFGMYAMGGMGKTTMSRVLCNEFSSEFLAKVCHVELNNHPIIDLQKSLLRTLTKWHEIDMSKLANESEVRKLLIEHVPKHRLFLVVDNVWDQQNSIQEAQSFLSLPFKKGSVVLVTARSKEILNVFKNIKQCFSTPFLDTHAAANIFLNSLGYTSLDQLEPKDQALTRTFVNSCCFSMLSSLGGGVYHPLALKMLGGYVRRYTGPWENIKIDFKSVGENEKIDPLFSVLEIGWEALSENCQNLFLDLVQFMTHCDSYKFLDNTVKRFSKWYCTVFDVGGQELHEMLEVLKRRSVLNTHDFKYGERFFSVHDLYREFAKREANKSTHLRNCILHGRGHGEHYQRKRLTIHGNKIISLTKQGLCECSTNVEILRVVGCDLLTKVDLRCMKDLLSIELLHCIHLEQVCLDNLQNLVWLDFQSDSSMIPSITGLVSLQVLKLNVGDRGAENSKLPICGLSDLLRDCTSLLELKIKGYSKKLEFPDLSNSKKLRRLTGKYQSNIKKLQGLSNLVELQHLNLCGAGLIEVDGLEFLSKLEELNMINCLNLKAIPSLANLGLTLHTLIIRGCPDLEIVPSLEKLSCLKHIDLSFSKQVQEICGIDQLQNLRYFNCSGTSIRYLPDLSMLTKLEKLDVSRTPILHIGNLSKSLRKFGVVQCPNVKQLPDVSHLGCLDIFGCNNIQEIGTYQLQNLSIFTNNEIRIVNFPSIVPPHSVMQAMLKLVRIARQTIVSTWSWDPCALGIPFMKFFDL